MTLTPITITHLGGETCVTGSCHLVRFHPDQGSGIQITRLYQDMDDCWDREAKALKAAGNHPLRFNHLYAVEKFQDHRHLLHLNGPAVIIAGSGMCTGGRIVNHLKHGLDDPKNDLFFVGHQAQGTPGRAIVQGRTHRKALPVLAGQY